jgi:hypothetical protein
VTVPLIATAMACLAALASALVLNTVTETLVARAFRESTELFYAADGSAAFAMSELARHADPPRVIDDGLPSSFVDGPPGGRRELGTTTVDLVDMTDDANRRLARESPLAEYRLYAYGRLADMLGEPSSPASPYVVVWLADITAERLGAEGGERTLSFLATALGLTGGRRTIELQVRMQPPRETDGTSGIVFHSWREVR